MDVRRYHNRDTTDTPVALSNKTLPGLVVLAIGIIIVITGLILLAAFGVPKDISTNPEKLSGVVALGVGVVISVIGVIMSIVLRKRAREAKREAKRRQREAQQEQQAARQAARIAPVPYTEPHHAVNAKQHEQAYAHPSYPGQMYGSENGYQDAHAYSTRVET